MADEKQTKGSVKKTEEKKGGFVAWLKALPSKIASPFKKMWHELKRVTWPTRRKLMVYSAIVLAFMLISGVVIGLIDLGATTAVRAIGGNKSANGSTTTEATSTVATEAETTEEAAPEVTEEAAAPEATEEAAPTSDVQ